MNWEEIKNVVTILAIIAAGVWTFYRFGITRERHPKLEFDLDMTILGKANDQILIELIAIIRNKGLTRQYIRDFSFSLRYLKLEDEIDTSDTNINYQVIFPNLVVKQNWVVATPLPFVDGGIVHRFSYIAAVPIHADVILIYSKFKDPKKSVLRRSSDIYHISKTFKVAESINVLSESKGISF